HHRVLGVEEELRQRARGLRLAHARGTQENERANGTIGILEPRTGTPYRIRHGSHGFALPDHARREHLLQLREPGALALHHPGDGNTRPPGDDLRNVVRVDFLLEKLRRSGLARPHGLVRILHLLLEFRDAAVRDLGGLAQITAALGLLGFQSRLFELLLQLAHLAQAFLLRLPLGLHGRGLLAEVRQLALECRTAFLRLRVLLLAQCLPFDFELRHAPFHLVDLLRHGVDLDAQPRGRLVHEVNGLVRQKAIADVAVGQGRRGHHRAIRDAHAVVHLVALLETAQNGDRVRHARLAHVHRLETPLERRVLLDMLAILVELGGAHYAQLAARQHGLEHVARIHGAFRGARADERVQLVNEDDELSVARGDLLEHRLESLLELTAELGAGNEGAEVESHEALVLEALRYIAVHDALRESLDDGRLADAGFADEHRIVLRAARKHLYHAADFLVAADYGIELALARRLGEIARVALQRLVLRLRRLIG